MDLRLIGPCLGPSGYADEGRTLLRELATRTGVRLSLAPLRFGAPAPEDLEDLVLVKDASARVPASPFLAVHLLFPTMVRFDVEPSPAAHVIRTMFETDGLPPSWVGPLLRADEVWVPTDANRTSFAMAGIPPARIRVVPEPLDPDRFDPETNAPDPVVRGNGRSFVFLSVFDWSLRKGPDLLLRAFAEEFRPGEAELVLKVHSSLGAAPESLEQAAREIVARARRGRPGPAVRFLRGFRSPKTMPSLYAGADAFVLATRGEGWGRTIHEAMASATPVIATCAGATAALVGPPGVAYPVAATPTPVPDEALAQAPDYRGQSWWEPSVQGLRARMREVFEDRAGSRATGARAAASTSAASRRRRSWTSSSRGPPRYSRAPRRRSGPDAEPPARDLTRAGSRPRSTSSRSNP